MKACDLKKQMLREYVHSKKPFCIVKTCKCFNMCVYMKKHIHVNMCKYIHIDVSGSKDSTA